MGVREGLFRARVSFRVLRAQSAMTARSSAPASPLNAGPPRLAMLEAPGHGDFNGFCLRLKDLNLLFLLDASIRELHPSPSSRSSCKSNATAHQKWPLCMALAVADPWREQDECPARLHGQRRPRLETGKGWLKTAP